MSWTLTCAKRNCPNQFQSRWLYSSATCQDHRAEHFELVEAQYNRSLTRDQVDRVMQLYGSNAWYAAQLIDLCEKYNLVPQTGVDGCVHKLRKPTHPKTNIECYKAISWGYAYMDHVVWLRQADVPAKWSPWVVLTQPYREFTGSEDLPSWADHVVYVDSPYLQGEPMHAALLWHSEGGYELPLTISSAGK